MLEFQLTATMCLNLFLQSDIVNLCLPFVAIHKLNNSVYVGRSHVCKCFLSKHSKKKKSSPNNHATVLRALREIQEEKKKTFKHEIFRI